VNAIAVEMKRRRRPSRLPQFRDLARRAVRSTAHGGDALALPIVFPLIILAINVKALQSILLIGGFPAGNVTDFVIALTFLQGALFSGIACASRMASDIESGFIKRIVLAPVSMMTVVGARLASVALVGLLQAACFLIAALLGGASVASGVAGVFALAALLLLFDMAFAGLGILLAVISRSGEAVQSLFPVFFVVVMLSSALMPRNLVEVKWFRDVAEANPVTYMLEAVRSLFLKGWNAHALELGIGMALGILVLTSTLSLVGMRRLVVKP
jgi:ABC-2 type transport system permease protein